MPKIIVWVLRWRPKQPYLCTLQSSKSVFGYLKYVMGYGVAPQTCIPLHTMGQKRCFWIPKVVVFQTHHAKKYAVGPGVAPQTRIPLHTMGQKRCFWIPKMVVFETHHERE